MIVYHGSDSNFKKLRVSKSLVKHESSLLNEGVGIYVSTDKEVCRSYGKYLYTIEVNNNCMYDFRKMGVIKNYISGIRRAVMKAGGIDIANYMNLGTLAEYLYSGGVAISRTCEEIKMLLDSNENYYRLKRVQTNSVEALLNKYDKNSLKAYMFNYNIKNTGVIKDVSESVARIMDKQKII